MQGCSQARHGPMSLTCSPPRTVRDWGRGVIIFYYSERNTNPNEQRLKKRRERERESGSERVTKLNAAGLASCLTFSS